MKGKALIIEDDKTWESTLKGYLEKAGYFVETCDKLGSALEIIQKELFHIITVDMQLNEKTTNKEGFEGWSIIEKLKKADIDKRTVIVVITAFETEYGELKEAKHKIISKAVDNLFFMGKGDFNRKEFLDTIDKEVERRNMRFYNDHRDF